MSGEKPQHPPIRIAFVGDVMLGRLVSRELQRRPPESFWSDVGPLLRSCEATIANLECAITRHKQQWKRTRKVFHFGADPAAVDVLKAGNIRAVSLANNHVLDFEAAGLIEMLQLLDAACIAHAGAGVDETAARQPALFAAGPLKIALFACVDHEQSFAASPQLPGTAYVDPEASECTPFPDAAQISETREKGTDLVVLSTHFGPNMVFQPSRAIATYRRAAADRGIDIIYGHSAHLFQGIERYGRSLILHDTGDFLDDYAIDPELHNDWSFVFIIEADTTGLRELTLVPVVLEFACVRLATEREAEALFGRMTKLSSAFRTHLVQSTSGLALTLDLCPAPPAKP
ncbi:MAG: CapA family protein [Rhizomicrobium sp.]